MTLPAKCLLTVLLRLKGMCVGIWVYNSRNSIRFVCNALITLRLKAITHLALVFA